MSDIEQGPLPGHEHLTMHDQMRAVGIPSRPTTSPVTGAVENRRREFLKERIQYRANQAANRDAFNFNAGEERMAGGGSGGAT